MKNILEEVGEMIDIDSRIFRSILPFLFRPGFLTREYLAGKRKTYMSPFRLYLLLSVIFFFLAQATSKNINESGGDWLQIRTDSSDTIIRNDSLAIEMIRKDSLFLTEVDSVSSVKNPTFLSRK